MVNQPTDHPEYDTAMELLCSLSVTPKGIGGLAEELGVTHGDILLLARQLKDKGHAVGWGHYRAHNPQFARVISCNGHRSEREQSQEAFVWLLRYGASLAQEAAQRYWERTR